MTKSEVLELFTALNSLGNMTGVKFAYAVAKNMSLLKPEVEALQKANLEYETQRIELANKYSKKDVDGNPIITNNSFAIEDQTKFESELKLLKEKTKYSEYEQLLKQESDFKPYKIKLEDVPKEITVAQMFGLKEIIDE